MKRARILIAFMLCIMLLTILGCAYNKQIFDTKYEFNTAVITIGNEVKTVKVDKWNDWDDSDMVQVVTKDGTVYYTHSSNVVLIKEGKK